MRQKKQDLTKSGRTSGSRCLVRPILLVLAAVATGTGCTVFLDQVEVPGTGQRLIVGHDGMPFKKAWVMENGKLHKVTIVEKAR